MVIIKRSRLTNAVYWKALIYRYVGVASPKAFLVFTNVRFAPESLSVKEMHKRIEDIASRNISQIYTGAFLANKDKPNPTLGLNIYIIIYIGYFLYYKTETTFR